MFDPMAIVAHFEKNPMHAIMFILILYRCVAIDCSCHVSAGTLPSYC